MSYKDTTKQQEYQKAYQPSYQRQRYLKKKQEFLDYLGNECSGCGSIESLEFHHIDPDIKEYAIMKNWKYNFDRIKSELDKCILLCHTCHKEETYSKHGSVV